MLLGTLIATGFAACYTRQQWLTSVDHEQRSLRAYVGVAGHTLVNVTKGQRPHSEIIIKNFGQTPASNFSYWINSTIDTAQSPTKLAEKPFSDDNVLFPTDGSTLISEFADPLTDTDMADISRGSAMLYVYGQIKYHDAFGERRCTKFRLMFGGDILTHLTTPRLAIAPEGNEIDKNCTK